MPYPTRERKKFKVFQSYEDGDKHAPVSVRVQEARQRKSDRQRKTGTEKETVKNMVDKTMKKKAKTTKKVDKLVVKLKMRKAKQDEKNTKWINTNMFYVLSNEYAYNKQFYIFEQ